MNQFKLVFAIKQRSQINTSNNHTNYYKNAYFICSISHLTAENAPYAITCKYKNMFANSTIPHESKDQLINKRYFGRNFGIQKVNTLALNIQMLRKFII